MKTLRIAACLCLWTAPFVAGLTYPAPVNTSALAAIRAEMDYTSLPSCPTPGPTAAPGNVPSPITNIGDLKTAAGAATNGDVICILNTANIVGQVNFDNSNTSFVTIRTSAAMPSPMRRALATDSYPTLKVTGDIPAIIFGENAKRYRVVGLEVSPNDNVFTQHLIRVGPDQATSNCELIDLDRLIIHGNSAQPTYAANKGVQVYNCKSWALQRSYIYNIRGSKVTSSGGDDANAINASQSPCCGIIENNYLEASGENIMFGGSDLKIATNQSDFIVRGNLLEKNVSQKSNKSYYRAKNLLEVKTGNRILIEGNIFRNYWDEPATTQHYAVVFKSTSQCNAGYQIKQTSNITFRLNKIDKFSNGFTLGHFHPACGSGVEKGNENLSPGGGYFLIQDNLFTKLGEWQQEFAQGHALMFQIALPKMPTGAGRVTANDIIIENNTLGSLGNTNDGTPLPSVYHSAAFKDNNGGFAKMAGFAFRNNVFLGSMPNTNGGAFTAADYAAYFTDSILTHNLGISTLPAGITTPPNYTISGGLANAFIDAAGGNYRLKAPYSTYVGTDGQPLGADITALDNCTLGAATNWTGSCPGQTNISVSLLANGSIGPISVASGANVALTWTVGNSTNCTPAGWSGTITYPTGSQTVNPTANTVYTLTCTGSAPTQFASVAVSIAGGPGFPVNVSPPYGTTLTTLTPTLSWFAAGGAESYNVFLDTSTNPTTNVASTPGNCVNGTCSYTVTSPLTPATLYAWKIVAVNTFGSTAGGIGSFATPNSSLPLPGPVTYRSPSPADGATNVPRPTLLAWNGANNAAVYDIYVGTANPPALFTADWSDIERLFTTLQANTLYYWKVVARNATGSTSGLVQSFTTAPEPTGCPSNP